MKKKLWLFLIVACTTVQLKAQKLFKDERYGISMEQPKDWLVGSQQLMHENLGKLKLSDADAAKILKDSNGSVVLASFYQYDPKEHAGLIPTVQVIVRSNPASDFDQFHAVFSRSGESFKTVFPDFAFSLKPEVKEIDGIKSSYFIGNYTLSGKTDGSAKVKVRCIGIPRGSYFLQLTFIDEVGNKENEPLFDQLISSVKIAKD